MKQQTRKQSKKVEQKKTAKKTAAAAPVTDPKAESTHKREQPANRTIKTVVIETLAANSGTTNADMIAAVKAEFPKSAFDEKHASWYRSQARKGLLTGTPIAIPAQRSSKSSAK